MTIDRFRRPEFSFRFVSGPLWRKQTENKPPRPTTTKRAGVHLPISQSLPTKLIRSLLCFTRSPVAYGRCRPCRSRARVGWGSVVSSVSSHQRKKIGESLSGDSSSSECLSRHSFSSVRNPVVPCHPAMKKNEKAPKPRRLGRGLDALY